MRDHDLSLEDIEGFEGEDPGTEWHPESKPLTDLSDSEVEEHKLKPESLSQPDAGQVLDHDGEDEGSGL